jgi:tRNA dimethylallyltransferase
MDIGTAKPAVKELSLVPHHLINIVNPDEAFSLAQYQALAFRAISDIQRRQKLPLLVGGSGLYVWAVLEGWKIPQVPPDPEFRHRLEVEAVNTGIDKLYLKLMGAAPDIAQKIDRRNVRRVIRALEVHKNTGNSSSQEKKEPPFSAFIIGLTADRATLYRIIDQRVDEMIEQGLLTEVEKLVNMGYDFNLPAISGIGYKQIGMLLKGELNLVDAAQKIKFETHRFARHQYAWFRLKDDRINWFDIPSRGDSEIAAVLDEFLKSKPVQPETTIHNV